MTRRGQPHTHTNSLILTKPHPKQKKKPETEISIAEHAAKAFTDENTRTPPPPTPLGRKMGDYYRGGNRDGNRRAPKRRHRSGTCRAGAVVRLRLASAEIDCVCARPEEADGDHPRGGRGRYEREDPLQRLKRETIQIADSPLVKVEDAIRSIATGFTAGFADEEFREGYIQCLHDL